MINEALKKLYVSALPRLNTMYSELDAVGVLDYAGPLMLHCWEDNYQASPYKLMIFGQEANGWKDDYAKTEEDVDAFVNVYKKFELAKRYHSFFWQYVNKINWMLNGENRLNFVWNNVNKFGVQGKGRPDSRVLQQEVMHFNVLASEIAICKPDVCIFLSGPRYDGDLKMKLNELKIEQFGDYPKNEVARLVSPDLPKHSYRTYHPGYGNRYPDWYNEVLEKIVGECKGEFITH